jgi:hypothetical protein
LRKQPPGGPLGVRTEALARRNNEAGKQTRGHRRPPATHVDAADELRSLIGASSSKARREVGGCAGYGPRFASGTDTVGRHWPEYAVYYLRILRSCL